MFNKFSQWIVLSLEDVFGWYGGFVARRPVTMVASCLLITGLALIGMINYRTENNAFKLWIPDNSDFVENFAWLEEHSPPEIRFNSLILTSETSVLTPEVLLHMFRIHENVSRLVTEESGLSWDKVCYDIPVISHQDAGIPDPGPDFCDGTPWLQPCYPHPWCEAVEAITTSACFEQSLLELWGYDETVYRNLTQEEILDKINEVNLVSDVFLTPINVTTYLGDVTWDGDRIVSAGATFMQWYGKINSSDISSDDISDMGTGEIVDQGSLEWEAALRDELMADQENLPQGVVTYINVARAFSDIAGETIVGDAMMMPVSFMIMFAYVTIMLGKFNCLQQRGMLALAGLACIGLSIGFTYGFCSALGLFYGPMHNLIPFLLLGIGVDDMFVIMQCFDNLSPKERDLSNIPTAISLTMRRAGVAITVTSLTDFMVFAIGSTTVLPALMSFCLWCGVGILATYFFQITLFAGALALDCKRLHQGRNGFCPCYRHKVEEEKTNRPVRHEKKLSIAQKALGFFADIILSLPGQIIVILSTLALLSCGLWQITMLRQEFKSIWFLPPSTYLRQWFDASDKYFPGDGERVVVYIAETDIASNLDKIEQLVTSFEEADDIIKTVDAWYPSFKSFCNLNLGTDIPDQEINGTMFDRMLTQFLYNAAPNTLGLRFIPSFKFMNSELLCGEPAPEILLTTITFTHHKFSDRSEHIPALNKVKEIIKDCDIDGLVFPFNQVKFECNASRFMYLLRNTQTGKQTRSSQGSS